MLAFPRRPTRTVSVGHLPVGSDYPIRLQSMLTSATMDTASCVQESLALMEAGCEIIRITAPTVKAAAHLETLRKALHAAGCQLPLVADIHFKPEAALEAAKWVEKVRINPGNFADSKKFLVREYSDHEYKKELERIRERFTPLVKRCQENGVAMRIGTNHGSLSDRIMNRFGDTPSGMVESALEFARIARDLGYHQFLFSMKASNPKVMIAAYRLLVARLEREGNDWNYPLHLGVTEAGDGEDGRIKSAVGIGSLLYDGMGDTVRVSLTEDSPHEIPVARALVHLCQSSTTRESKKQLASRALSNQTLEENQDKSTAPSTQHYPPFFPLSEQIYQRRPSHSVEIVSLAGSKICLGEKAPPRILLMQKDWEHFLQQENCHPSSTRELLSSLGEMIPEAIIENLSLCTIPLEVKSGTLFSSEKVIREITSSAKISSSSLLTLSPNTKLEGYQLLEVFRKVAHQLQEPFPILLKLPSGSSNKTEIEYLLEYSALLGSLLCDGIGDALLIEPHPSWDLKKTMQIAYALLQATGTRITKTDYVACPSCGRTLFNLQETTARIRQATGHLKGVRIAVMGCIVNGPGEMADADFGYVGGAPGKINLYIGKKPVAFNIPQEKAVEELIALIQQEGIWQEPPTKEKNR